ncbi:MAG: hypothetical protein U0903_21490 [Planctomycetales bacterium]
MPQFLALTIDESLVRGAVADVSSGRVELRRTFEARSPSPLLTGDLAQNQSWLRETLKQHGITADQVLVSVTRNAAIVRRLELPPVPLNELPTYVGFQARTKLAQPIDTLVWDFLPAPQANTGLAVLLAALPKTQFNTLNSVLTGAGLKPVQYSFTTASLAEYATHGHAAYRSPQSPPLMIVHLDGDRLEMGLLQQGVLTATHGYHLSHEDPTVPQILTEITRASMAFQKLLPPGVGSPQLLLSAAEPLATELSAAIAGRFTQTPELLALPTAVRMLDASATLPLSSVVELVGQLLSQAGSSLPAINLLAPRRTQPKKDYSRRRIVILAVGVLAILGTGGGLYAMQWSDASRKVAQLQKEEEKLTAYLKRAEPTLKSGQAVENWQQMKVDWIDELKQFSTVLPPGDKLFLTNIQFKGIATPNPLHRGMITLNGSAKQRDDVIKLEMDAVNVPDRYQVLPHTVKTRNTAQPGNQEGQPQGNQNNAYPIEFDLTLNLNVPKKNAAKPAVPANAKPATGTAAATTPGKDTKPAEAKPGDNKPVDNKPGDAKPSDENKTPPAENKGAPATPPPAQPAAPKEPEKTPAAAPAQPAAPAAAPAAAPTATTDAPATATPQAAPATGGQP